MDIKNLKDSDMKHRDYYDVPKKKIQIFEDSWDKIKLPDPPANDSKETFEELKLIEKSFKSLTTKQKKEIKEQDGYWPRLNTIFYDALKIDDPTLEKFIYLLEMDTEIAVKHYKKKYDRPRPAFLASKMGEQFKIFPSKTASTASYPSGHATFGALAAKVLGHMFPEKKPELSELGKSMGKNRILAGLHYPSDYKAGVLLADELYKLLKVTYLAKEHVTFSIWFHTS
jgi:acid phosphatase (class A)